MVRAASKYYKEQAAQEKKVVREDEVKLRRIASRMARDVRKWWAQIDKVLLYKEQAKLDEQVCLCLRMCVYVYV